MSFVIDGLLLWTMEQRQANGRPKDSYLPQPSRVSTSQRRDARWRVPNTSIVRAISRSSHLHAACGASLCFSERARSATSEIWIEDAVYNRLHVVQVR